MKSVYQTRMYLGGPRYEGTNMDANCKLFLTYLTPHRWWNCL